VKRPSHHYQTWTIMGKMGQTTVSLILVTACEANVSISTATAI